MRKLGYSDTVTPNRLRRVEAALTRLGEKGVVYVPIYQAHDGYTEFTVRTGHLQNAKAKTLTVLHTILDGDEETLDAAIALLLGAQ